MSSVKKDPGKALWIARISRIVGLLRISDLFYERMAAVTRRGNSGLDHVLACLRQRRVSIWRPKISVSAAPEPDSGKITWIEFLSIHIDQVGTRCGSCGLWYGGGSCLPFPPGLLGSLNRHGKKQHKFTERQKKH